MWQKIRRFWFFGFTSILCSVQILGIWPKFGHQSLCCGNWSISETGILRQKMTQVFIKSFYRNFSLVSWKHNEDKEKSPKKRKLLFSKENAIKCKTGTQQVSGNMLANWGGMVIKEKIFEEMWKLLCTPIDNRNSCCQTTLTLRGDFLWLEKKHGIIFRR